MKIASKSRSSKKMTLSPKPLFLIVTSRFCSQGEINYAEVAPLLVLKKHTALLR